MPLYECVMLARQDISASQAEGLIAQFEQLITEGGGSVPKKEYWGLKSLSYRIKKNRKAHYALMNIDGPHTAVAEMERQMRLHDDVLRYQTIRVDAIEEGPSVMMQSRGRDDRRGGPGGRGGRGERRDRDDRGPREDRPPRDDRPPREDRPRDDRPPREAQ